MYALGNIIQNAIHYCKTNVIAEVEYLNNDILVKIKDDGNGFSKDILDKLGEPYISKDKDGMGLGIFISKNLIENMGGKITFYNTKDNNAVVEINLINAILKIWQKNC